MKIKYSYLSQDLLQDNGECLKSAVTSCQEPLELLDVLVRPPTLDSTRWHHIWRSAALARFRPSLLRGLLAGAGLGFVLVHCERTSVESCDNIDHHHAPLHGCCGSSGSSTTNPYQTVRVMDVRWLRYQRLRYFCSSQQRCPIRQSDDSECCLSDQM